MLFNRVSLFFRFPAAPGLSLLYNPVLLYHAVVRVVAVIAVKMALTSPIHTKPANVQLQTAVTRQPAS
jgi:hypothetical protein